ncbi:MAG: phosphatidylserine decarboxylase family protein [Rikenellaceae bacterium]
MTTIDKEGYNIIRNTTLIITALIIACFLFLPLSIAIAITVILVAFLLFIVRFFRVPNRKPLSNPSYVYAPADGTVVVSERVKEDEVLNGECRIQVSIFMSLWNVHANWFPVGGRVEYFRHHNGDNMVAWHPKSSTENERTTTVVETTVGQRIMFRQIAGLLAKRIVSYAKEGVNVEQNSRCGFIKFGSRVDLFLPLDTEIKVQLGDKVVGSQTVIAVLNNKK